MRLEVKCNVEACKYWDRGDQCVADSIYVVGLNGRQESTNVDETACKTFEER